VPEKGAFYVTEQNPSVAGLWIKNKLILGVKTKSRVKKIPPNKAISFSLDVSFKTCFHLFFQTTIVVDRGFQPQIEPNGLVTIQV